MKKHLALCALLAVCYSVGSAQAAELGKAQKAAKAEVKAAKTEVKAEKQNGFTQVMEKFSFKKEAQPADPKAAFKAARQEVNASCAEVDAASKKLQAKPAAPAVKEAPKSTWTKYFGWNSADSADAAKKNAADAGVKASQKAVKAAQTEMKAAKLVDAKGTKEVKLAQADMQTVNAKVQSAKTAKNAVEKKENFLQRIF